MQSEATNRGYSFDLNKIGQFQPVDLISVTSGQIEFEKQHLLAKLSVRNPLVFLQFNQIVSIESHPLFAMVTGDVELWERR